MSLAVSDVRPARSVRVLPLTHEERDEIASMLADSKSSAEICDWIGCTPAQVRALTKDTIVAPRARVITPETPVSSPTPPGAQREEAVLRLLAIAPVELAAICAELKITKASADHLMRRLSRAKRVHRVSGGRHMPHRQKACVWALPEGEGA